MESSPQLPCLQSMPDIIPKANRISSFKFIKAAGTDSLDKEFTNILWRDAVIDGHHCAASSRFAAVSPHHTIFLMYSSNLKCDLYSSHGRLEVQVLLLSVILRCQESSKIDNQF